MEHINTPARTSHRHDTRNPDHRTQDMAGRIDTVLCCLPFGIVGIVYASRVSSLLKSGNYAEAVEASKNAGKWTKIGFIVGLVATLLYIAFLAVYTFMASSF